MKALLGVVFLMTMLIGGSTVCAIRQAMAAEVGRGIVMKPTQSIVLDAGSKQILTFFIAAEGQCDLSAIVSDAYRDDTGQVRVQATLAPGGASRIDAGDGYLFQFTCSSGGQSMIAATLGGAPIFAGPERSVAPTSAAGRSLHMLRATGI